MDPDQRVLFSIMETDSGSLVGEVWKAMGDESIVITHHITGNVCNRGPIRKGYLRSLVTKAEEQFWLDMK